MFRVVPSRIFSPAVPACLLGLVLAATAHEAAAGIGPPLALCDMIGEGSLAAGDEFAGNVTVNPGGFGSGTWDHFTPERPSGRV